MSDETKETPGAETPPAASETETIEHVHHLHFLALDVTPRFQQFFVIWIFATMLLIVLKKGFQQ